MKVYCIENKLNGKKYVGVTTKTIEERYEKHIQGSRSKGNKLDIQKAIKKYGKENFTIKEIDSASTYEEMMEKEKYWIIKLDTKNKGYNATDGGEGSLGKVLSDETLKKMSDSMKKLYQENPDQKKVISEKTKEGMTRWWNGLSEEEKEDYKKRCSKRPEGWVQPTGWTYTHSEEAKEAIRQANLNKVLSEETKKKVSKSRKGKGTGEKNSMANPENRKKVSQSKIGRKRVYQPDGSFKYLFPDQVGG